MQNLALRRSHCLLTAQRLRWLIRIIVSFTVSALIFLPHGSASAADERSVAEQDVRGSLTHHFVRLSINQQVMDSAVLVLQDAQGNWLLPAERLEQARVRLPSDAPFVHEDEKAYVPLSSLGSADYQFDDLTQSLDIVLDSAVFQASAFRTYTARESSLPTTMAGMFINYDLLLTGGTGPHAQSLFTELGGSVGRGIALLSMAAIRNEESQRIIRLDTSYTLDNPPDMTSWRFGDSITRPPVMLGRPVRFGGIQYATNFRMQPGLLTMPIPTLSGQAALPSTVDLYVNNILQNSTSVPPGPFSITTAPIVTGDGEVLLRVRDIAGREELISGRFYSSASLLAPGLADFSVEAGGLRKNYGLPDDGYETPFASAAYRRGINEGLTLEGGLSAARNGPSGVTSSAIIAIPRWGILSLAGGLSTDPQGSKTQHAVSFERRTSTASFFARSERSDAHYYQLGIDPAFRTRALDTAFFSYRLNELGSLGLSYTRQQRAIGDPTEILGLSFSTRRSTLGSFVFSALRSRSEESNYAVSVYWILPIEKEWSASLSHTANQHTPDTTIFQAQKSAPYGEGIGWRLQTAINAAQQAAVYLQKSFGTLQAEAASLDGRNSGRIGFSGAVAQIDGHWFPTRRIAGSYGLVHLPGLNNVRIYVDNQFTSRTDSEGYALLPRLHPYAPNHVSLEQMDLPLDTRIDQLVAQPVPGWRSGVMVNFKVRKLLAATLRVVDVRGHDIPAGAMVTLQGSADTFAVGREGIAYVEGLSADNVLDIHWSGQHCSVSVPYAPSEDIVPYLGEFSCNEAVK